MNEQTATLYDRLEDSQFRFEMLMCEIEGGKRATLPTLRLYIGEQRMEVHYLIEYEKGVEAYEKLNMRLEDKFSLRHWFKSQDLKQQKKQK